MSPEPNPPSVFAPLDQAAMIARIEATDDDDLGSAFFDDSMREVEDAAVRMFDIGIRTLTDDPAHRPTASFGSQPSASRTGGVADAPAPGAVGRFSDPGTRAAFIVGGPAALRE